MPNISQKIEALVCAIDAAAGKKQEQMIRTALAATAAHPAKKTCCPATLSNLANTLANAERNAAFARKSHRRSNHRL